MLKQETLDTSILASIVHLNVVNKSVNNYLLTLCANILETISPMFFVPNCRTNDNDQDR